MKRRWNFRGRGGEMSNTELRTGGGALDYFYDYENRLIEVNRSKANWMTFVYDYRTRRCE
jgi:hypothetical protein